MQWGPRPGVCQTPRSLHNTQKHTNKTQRIYRCIVKYPNRTCGLKSDWNLSTCPMFVLVQRTPANSVHSQQKSIAKVWHRFAINACFIFKSVYLIVCICIVCDEILQHDRRPLLATGFSYVWNSIQGLDFCFICRK